jgi:hypothetical protein
MAKLKDREMVTLTLDLSQAAVLTGIIVSALSQIETLLAPLMSSCKTMCEAQHHLFKMADAVEQASEIAQMLPESGPTRMLEEIEERLLKRLASLIRLTEHDHASIDDLTVVH